MKLYNSLTKQIDSISQTAATIYSCGPTVYNHVHIGNLSSFIYADILKRTLLESGIEVAHAMNFTDVDDKTINASKELSDLSPNEALKTVTARYEQSFLDDLDLLGFDLSSYLFVRATESIEQMKTMILEILDHNNAYIAEDGIYFKISNYKKAHNYGELVEITESSTGAARVNNDEYDKDNIHDFALWKFEKAGEPAWDFEIEGKNYPGRPGWHIECSAMSKNTLGLPMTIHTGGIDLKFPHHENEIAQALGAGEEGFSEFFFHNEHLLVEGEKMSKSKNNFYTLKQVVERGYHPLAFKLLVLRGHYRKNTNFSWHEMDRAEEQLLQLANMAALSHQQGSAEIDWSKESQLLKNALENDLNTPQFMGHLMNLRNRIYESGVSQPQQLQELLETAGRYIGINIFELYQPIKNEQIDLIKQREDARTEKDFSKSDKIRDQLLEQKIRLIDTPDGTIWLRTELS